jgi:opacity protein-like surface antigen
MKLIKQSKLLTLQVILSLIILNTQISFAQNKKVNLKDWEGSYVGIGVANSSSKTEIRALGTNVELGSDHYALNRGTKDKDQNEIIFKIGHLEQLNNNILLGIELNKYSDIKTSTLNTNSAAGTDGTQQNFTHFNNPSSGTDRNTLKLKDIISLELKLATVLENQDIFLNNLMIYGKLGVATLRSNQRNTEDLEPSHFGQSTARHYGSVVGIGIEKKLSIFDDPKISNNTSISIEYNMMNFNKKTSGSDKPIIYDTGYSVKPEINNLMLTINYRLSDNTLGLKNLIK